MTPEVASKMFLAAAIFNWVMGAVLFFIPNIFLDLFFVSPGVHQLLWVQQFAGLVFVFGIGYYWASIDLAANRGLIRLAIIAKSSVVLVGLFNVVMGEISWQFMIPASADAIFVALFILALKGAPQPTNSF
jgi:hypothetical protein